MTDFLIVDRGAEAATGATTAFFEDYVLGEDFTVNVDWFATAVTDSATCWTEATDISAIGVLSELDVDWLATAATASATCWLDTPGEGVDCDLTADGAGVSYWVDSISVGPGLDLNQLKIVGSKYVFKMRGLDAVSSSYDVWVVRDQPDFAGTYYVGALATPLRDITLIDTWPEDGLEALSS